MHAERQQSVANKLTKPLGDIVIFHKLKLSSEGGLFLVVFMFFFFSFVFKNVNINRFFWEGLLYNTFKLEQNSK